MRFMLMHKITPELEKGLPPSAEAMAAIGAMMGDAAGQNILLGGEGLRPSSERDHLVYRDGKRSLTAGPFTHVTELPSGYVLLRVRTKEEALTWCDAIAGALGDVQMYLGVVVEGWHLGMMPKPENPPLRFLVVPQVKPGADGDETPDPAVYAKMRAVLDDMNAAGVLQASSRLAGTRRGARVRFAGGKATVIDGPFAESKELISGFAIFELPSKDVAIDWAVKFGLTVGVEEVDVREVAE